MRFLKRLLIFLLILAMFMGGFMLKLLYDAGYFKKIAPHFAGTYAPITTQAGAEDLSIDYASGMAFISTDDRRFNSQNPQNPQKGKIYALDLKADKPIPIDLTGDFQADFHPHGISLYRKGDKLLVFVVNHRQEKTEKKSHIEIFEYINQRLVHLESIHDESLMYSPNDVVAVGERQFYVTNDHYYRPGDRRRVLEDYLRLTYAFVVYYDGKTFQKAAEGIGYPNGINVSLSGKQLYVASTTGRKVIVYHRDSNTGKLTELQDIYLNSGADNIEVDSDDHLWVGSHPQMLAFVAHARDAQKRSPSQIFKIEKKGEKFAQPKEIFLSDGKDFSGVSVGAYYQKSLLIGSVFEPGILWAKLSP
ncbi:MAG: SMP-30/gluconolactonase/LRE family protein [Microscillaceae bacterium]|jgi:arylesterase/paraoxonase|nr:SMP-30/gluconolactonase/LRE family protein [Microscillaceae bacterium]